MALALRGWLAGVVFLTTLSAHALLIEPGDAERFLMQASFGPTEADVARVKELHYEGWITEQFQRPASHNLPLLLELKTRTDLVKEGKLNNAHRKYIWWRNAVTGGDQLRQRLAYAWSQIFVVSDEANSLSGNPEALAHYYDTLVDQGLGNYRTLLGAVTHHPAMGVYLTYLRNEKADPEGKRRPDENYAREIMQLFTIGLYELNPDGTRQLVKGQPVPTYTNEDIQELARVFTGMGFPPKDGKVGFKNAPQQWFTPLVHYPEFHDNGPKNILGRKTLPADQPAGKDVEDTLDILFHHPNTPPFVCRLLIQRLTTSNPSPGYLRRVSEVFVNNGRGVRGDLQAVVRAILMDAEARLPAATYDKGMQREPYLRLVSLVRAFRGTAKDGTFTVSNLAQFLGQEPGSARSVFNFYLPSYSPPGPIADAGLVAPEFEITNAVTAISLPNFLRDFIYRGKIGRAEGEVVLDFSREIQLARDPDALIQHLNLLLAGGRLRDSTRQIIRGAIGEIPDTKPEERAKLAVYLTSISPESAILP
ncbi:MAG: DUF1800 domain-containing protein [Candidatus Methylacidiphilales bacterium]|nr:DUF1800 domain-containing protein [Candidatus Methylacidiphilales bacterium]